MIKFSIFKSSKEANQSPGNNGLAKQVWDKGFS